METEKIVDTSVFFKQMSGKADHDIEMMALSLKPGYGIDNIKAPQYKRFEKLMEYLAYTALSKVWVRLPGVWDSSDLRLEEIEKCCQRVFNRTIRESMALLFQAKEIKADIKALKIKTKDLVTVAQAAIKAERMSMIKHTRDELANDLKTRRTRVRDLAMKIVALERKLAPWSEEMKARELMAEHLKRARQRLFEIRKLAAKEEGLMYAKHNGAPSCVSDLYPATPPASIPATEFGDGLPEASGIYFLWDQGRVHYVGQAIRLNQRVRLKGSHHILKPYMTISYLPFDTRDLNWAECWYIGTLRPLGNFGKRSARYHVEQT